MKKNDCIKELFISRSTDPWSGMTGSWEEEEANKNISAGKIDAENCEFFPHLDSYKENNHQLLAKKKDKPLVIINEKYFSALKKVDATGLNRDEVMEIGTIYLNAFSKIDFQKIAAFLLEAQIIVTYWHLESTVCLIREEDLPEHYIAHFEGEHLYYTNEKNVDFFSFSIKINKKSGMLSIQKF